ncbi:MAG TPA: SDR family oxidoreductase [Acidimicrobiales bacterium]|jgi:NAD(P)-dependent dehydrogenase (short-subunit alcohol dehydrogenase family)
MSAAQSRFEGKVVAITGGGMGIGRTYGRRFAAEGASIVVADLDPDVGEREAKELEAQGAQAVSVAMDVSDEAGAAAMVEVATHAFGGIDILVNNAGIHLEHAQLPFTVEALPKWRRVLDVNVIGALNCSAACRPSMKARGGGAIINQSTMAAYLGGGAYSVSKLALNTLTVGLAADFAADGIRVNGIAPSLVDSEAAMASMAPAAQQGVIAGQMIKRLGTMEDLANMALFLCSDDASFVTGQTILVDGGFVKKAW